MYVANEHNSAEHSLIQLQFVEKNNKLECRAEPSS